MARVNGRKPPVFVNSRPDDKGAKLPGHRQISRGYVLGCGALLHATGNTGDPVPFMRPTCGEMTNGVMLLCEACMQTCDSFSMPVQARTVAKDASEGDE